MNALLAIQMELKAPKGQFNKFGNFRYRSCEDILEAVKPLLQKHGAVLVLSDEIVQFGTALFLKASATLKSLDGSESVTVTAYAKHADDGKKCMDPSQITGAASSYARKYALNGLFLIDDAQDSDAMQPEGQPPPRMPPTTIPPPRIPPPGGAPPPVNVRPGAAIPQPPPPIRR